MSSLFAWPIILTILVSVIAWRVAGVQAFMLTAILIIFEISLSFDNAIVNATVLVKMNQFWQKMFLSIGIVIAVFGVRLVLPVLIVSLTTQLGINKVVDIALNHPDRYSTLLQTTHPAVAAFGGAFLLMIFLTFAFQDKEVMWLRPLEKLLTKAGKLDQLPTFTTLLVLLGVSQTLSDQHKTTVMIAGILGLATFLAINIFNHLLTKNQASNHRSSNLSLFIYLELIDLSFSLDGVIGAFAISNNIFIIATGLGVGAIWIRSLTLHLVRQKALQKYIYIEHGAHYAIGALAILLLMSIEHSLPEIITGLVGISFIAAAFISSLLHNKRSPALE
ncbi:MAG TPA: DUF475 domain-containing protein [Patescibacteria group bacterium]|jgi:hypothetical protein|nr:DUF475 domain-containing protein [Patescibacteria group bacterium]